MKSLGKRAAGLRLERMRMSPLWAGDAFRNVHPVLPGLRNATAPPSLSEFLRSDGRRVPPGPLPSVDPIDIWRQPAETSLRATWPGHSTMLIEIDGLFRWSTTSCAHDSRRCTSDRPSTTIRTPPGDDDNRRQTGPMAIRRGAMRATVQLEELARIGFRQGKAMRFSQLGELSRQIAEALGWCVVTPKEYEENQLCERPWRRRISRTPRIGARGRIATGAGARKGLVGGARGRFRAAREGGRA